MALFFAERNAAKMALCCWRKMAKKGAFQKKFERKKLAKNGTFETKNRLSPRVGFVLSNPRYKRTKTRTSIFVCSAQFNSKKTTSFFGLLSRSFLIFCSVLNSESGLNVLSGSACLCYRVYNQGILGTAIIIPSYALAAASSP